MVLKCLEKMNVFEKMNIDIWIFVNSDKELYQQIFLEELKNSIKKKKVIYTINEELRLDKSDNESDDDADKFDGLH